jgi:hypothetical protein
MVINNKNAELPMTKIGINRCPCDEKCRQKRETVVNLIIDNGTCTAKDLHNLLDGKLGVYALRSSMEYLSTGKCNLVGVFGLEDKQKPPQFGKKGRLYYSKKLPQAFLRSSVLSNIAPLQKRILDKVRKSNKKTFYFSKYDIRRITPSSGIEIDYALRRLVQFGFLSRVFSSGIEFYVETNNLARFHKDEVKAVIDNKTEYSIVKSVHELIMNIYPSRLITSYNGRIRPHTTEILTITGGMSFDIFYDFFDPINGMTYLAIDVYTRIPVTGYMVNSFAKKIEWAKSVKINITTNYLRKKTIGIIIFRSASPNAIPTAKKLGIQFLRLEDVRVNYTEIRQKVEKELAY